MKFKNTHNQCLVIPITWWQKISNFLLRKNHYTEREIWLSRSVAVVATISVLFRGELYILINKRGTGTPDFQGLWNLPCGYLDYDETTGEAAVREVWEECGVNVTEINSMHIFNYMDKPWDTNSKPVENRQNVSFAHGFLGHVDKLPDTSLENNEPDEVEKVLWIKLKDYKQYDYAFNHNERIEKFINRLPQNFQKNL